MTPQGGGAKEDEAEGESDGEDAGDRLWEGKKLFVVRSKTGRQKMNPDLRAGFHKKKDVVALGMDFLTKLKQTKQKGDSTKAGRHRALESAEKVWPVVVCPSRVTVIDSKGEALDVSAGLPKGPGHYKYTKATAGKTDRKVKKKRDQEAVQEEADEENKKGKQPKAKKPKCLQIQDDDSEEEKTQKTAKKARKKPAQDVSEEEQTCEGCGKGRPIPGRTLCRSCWPPE